MLNVFRRKNPVYETMTCYTFCGWTVRVWREEPKLTYGPDPHRNGGLFYPDWK